MAVAKTLKVLVIEDDQFLQKAYKVKLTKDGHTYLSALDGEEGLKLAQEQVPDLILLDLMLPKMNGFDVLTKLKEDAKTKKIPVVIFSNLGQKEDQERGKSLGAKEYIVKANFSINDLPGKLLDWAK